MNVFRHLRREAGCSQEELAGLVGVSLESCRAWDSGRRAVPADVLARTRRVAAEQAAQQELLTLPQLALELGVHKSTLQLAARRGRLEVRFGKRSVYGRPSRRATRAAGRAFLMDAYHRRTRLPISVPSLIAVPDDYDLQLKRLRHGLAMTQEGLARRIGAAGKAVVYQWESRKRAPSPVFWREIAALLILSTGSTPRPEHGSGANDLPSPTAPMDQRRTPRSA